MTVTFRRGIRRGVALFLVAHCMIASITETGLRESSLYLLNLVVAVPLLVTLIGDATMRILIVQRIRNSGLGERGSFGQITPRFMVKEAGHVVTWDAWRSAPYDQGRR
jgi:hypothetical protein